MVDKLTPELLIRAYSQGVFPMGDSRDPQAPLRWYAPNPRCIIDIDNFHISKRLSRTYKQGRFTLKVDSAWEQVIRLCARREDTWITEEIIDVYTQLNRAGLAHSVEAYYNDELAGGLYGVSLGGAFMGESMFHTVRDASKIALIYLVERMKERGFTLLDCQFMTEHLSGFGAIHISKEEYLRRLELALLQDCRFI